jgi:hypothetical protein
VTDWPPSERVPLKPHIAWHLVWRSADPSPIVHQFCALAREIAVRRGWLSSRLAGLADAQDISRAAIGIGRPRPTM